MTEAGNDRTNGAASGELPDDHLTERPVNASSRLALQHYGEQRMAQPRHNRREERVKGRLPSP